MPAGDTMEPLERLLNLVALLLETNRPLTFEEIRETLDAYRSDNPDSAKRKFERDKDILREYGIPLRMTDTDVWGVEQGYVIPKDEYYLPEIAFTADEVTALFVAAQSGTEELAAAQGVRKLLYGSDVQGLPELFTLSAEWGRAALGEALDWLAARGGVPGGDGHAIARRILADNARAVYRL